jgi:hypothetical protein
MPASGFQPPAPDALDFFVGLGHARLATVTTGRGLPETGAGPNWRFHENDSRKLASVAPVWNVMEPWKVALDGRIFVDPERAARAVLGFVEIGAMYSPFKDFDFAIGLVRNTRDGALDAMVFTVGVSARY